MMNKTIYTLLRIAIGTSMFAHGLVRLPKLAAFSNWMINSFQKSMLPIALVKPFSYCLPVFEFSLGVLLIMGLFTKQALVIATIIMIMLIFGSGMIENWDAISAQLIHIAFFITLLVFIDHNKTSVDYLIRRKK